jgi:hypothetical protein
MLAADATLAPVVEDGRVIGLLSIELLAHVLGSES